MNIKRLLGSAVAVVLAEVAFGVDGVWTGVGGDSPATAANWFDPGNWKGGNVAEGESASADLSAAAGKYIYVDRPLSLGSLSGKSKDDPPVRLVGRGEGKIVFGASSAKANYVDLYLPSEDTTGTSASYSCVMADRVNAGVTTFSWGTDVGYRSELRMDRYACSPATERMDEHVLGATQGNYHYRGLILYGPAGSDVPLTCTVNQTSGSPYLTVVSQPVDVLCVGAAVTDGTGVPSGTFLRRIHADGTLELSNPVGEDGTEVEITFGAHRAGVWQTMKIMRTVAVGPCAYRGVWLNKYGAEDSLVLDIQTLQHNEASGLNDFVFGTESGYEPGLFVFHDSANLKAAPAETLKLSLSNAHIMFAEPYGAGRTPGFPDATLSVAAQKFARVTVTNNLVATVAKVTTSNGPFYKDGAGTLVVKALALGSAAGDKLVVEAGTLEIDEPADGRQPSVKTIELVAGAVLQLPPCGLFVQSLKADEGAVVRGPGILFLPPDVQVPAGLVRENGALVLSASPTAANLKAGEFSWSLAAAKRPDEIASVPAFWVDASDADSLEYDEEGVTKWKDVRAKGAATGAYGFATNCVLKPTLVRDASGRPLCIDFGYNGSSADPRNAHENARALWFDAPVKHVRAMFKVVNAYRGGGQFSCGIAGCYRREGYSCTTLLFENGAGRSFIQNGFFLANGELRDWGQGLPYSGAKTYTSTAGANRADEEFVPVVAEFHYGEDSEENPASPCVFGHSDNAVAGCNGLERIYECVFYTNELTRAERQAVRRHLMSKWLKAEANYVYGPVTPAPRGTPPTCEASIAELRLAGETTVDVAEGRAFDFRLATGAGMLVKTGPGELFVDDFALAEASIRAVGGTLNVRSFDNSAAALPGDPYLHMDATDASTRETNGLAVTRLSDVRGAGHPVAIPWLEGQVPALENAEIGGKAVQVIDFPAVVAAGGNPFAPKALVYPETSELSAVFSVIGGEMGGTMAGFLAPTYQENRWDSTVDYRMRGLFSTRAGTSATDLDWLNANTFWVPNFIGPGASHFAIDGTDTTVVGTREPAGFKVVSFTTYERVYANTFAAAGNEGARWAGGQKLAETIIYTNRVNNETRKLVDAYLNRKWFGRETAGYRPAVAASVRVDAGATLSVFGTAPISAASVAVAPGGTLDGALKLASGGTLTLSVLPDGTIAPMSVSGGLDLSAGGALALSSDARLVAGRYPLAAATAPLGDWGELSAGSRTVRLVCVDGVVCADVSAPGLILMFR